MNKTELIAKIVASLNDRLALLTKAAKASHAEATHESSRAENKYDTRGLEAAYLAGGQARQAKELIDAIESYQTLPMQSFSHNEPIDLTALVELEADRTIGFYFLGKSHGGLEIELDGNEITVITPQSPLGQNLMGKSAGQKWTAHTGGRVVKYRIVSVV